MTGPRLADLLARVRLIRQQQPVTAAALTAEINLMLACSEPAERTVLLLELSDAHRALLDEPDDQVFMRVMEAVAADRARHLTPAIEQAIQNREDREQQYRAKQVVEANLPTQLHRVPLDYYLNTGRDFSQNLLHDDWSGDEIDQAERLQRHIAAHPLTDDLATALTIEQSQLLIWGLGYWYHHGYPLVQTPHTYAAALMATSLGADVHEHLRPPWPVFMIELPTGLLSTKNHLGQDEELRWLLVDYRAPLRNRPIPERQAPLWNLHLLGAFGIHAYLKWLPRLAAPMPDHEMQPWELGDPFDSADERTMLLAQRLVAGACLAMSDPENLQRIGGARVTHPQHRGQPHDPPKPMRFKLGEALTLDCRPALRDYLGGHHAAPHVQVLVRGHWKLQPCGPAHTLRKTIWVHPYWRGPEDAPVILRPHVLVDTAS
jgi:hypothetical protein